MGDREKYSSFGSLRSPAHPHPRVLRARFPRSFFPKNLDFPIAKNALSACERETEKMLAHLIIPFVFI